MRQSPRPPFVTQRSPRFWSLSLPTVFAPDGFASDWPILSSNGITLRCPNLRHNLTERTVVSDCPTGSLPNTLERHRHFRSVQTISGFSSRGYRHWRKCLFFARRHIFPGFWNLVGHTDAQRNFRYPFETLASTFTIGLSDGAAFASKNHTFALDSLAAINRTQASDALSGAACESNWLGIFREPGAVRIRRYIFVTTETTLPGFENLAGYIVAQTILETVASESPQQVDRAFCTGFQSGSAPLFCDGATWNSRFGTPLL